MRVPRLSQALRAVREHRLLAAVVAVGALLRLAVVVGHPEPLLTFTDPNAYVRAAHGTLFLPLEGRAAGYPLLLRVLHDAWSSAVVPVVLQHAAALVGCLVLYATGRRLGSVASRSSRLRCGRCRSTGCGWSTSS